MAPKFTDLISSIGVGADGVTTEYPDTFIDDLSGAYAEDMAIPDARIQVLESDLAAANAAVLALQAENYTLIKMIPAAEGETSTNPDDAAGDGDDGEKDITTDDLFGDDDDDNDDK